MVREKRLLYYIQLNCLINVAKLLFTDLFTYYFFLYYDSEGGGAFKAPFPQSFRSQAFNFGAILLCIGEFSQWLKKSFTSCGQKLFFFF